jgi:catechol 2,3-dioxygenase-like lactoylglutathione lyase family enzyme
MIENVATVCIFVDDQDKAKAFYTEKLGFDLRGDMPLAPTTSNRWLAVAPKGSQTELILYKMDENWQHYQGVMHKSQAITLNVTDMAATVAELKGHGVKFTSEPDPQPWGTFATLEDPEGNTLLLVEQPKHTN